MGTYSLKCPHCFHEKSMFTAVWNAAFGNPPEQHMWHVYLTCVHCHMGVGAKLRLILGRTDGGPVNFQGNMESTYRMERFWPQSSTPAAPAHTPDGAANRFVDGEDNFARQRWNAAVAMYRAALDIATKSIDGVPKSLFYPRLKWLFENGRITKEIREWGDVVRLEGNDAMHEPDDFTRIEASALRFFTEMFLRYVFELPGEVKRFREETNPAETNG